ncbi:glutaredoxin [Serratia sp. Leaf50]|nr:glutaredoxin [Serratia sp. Leaf50]
MKLYVYDHCPFCVRARMIMGLKNIPVETVFLPNDDEATPIKMIGKKMLPILEADDNNFIGESLDIVTYIDKNFGKPVMNASEYADIDSWIENASQTIFKLAVPRWSYSAYPEFELGSSRQYFSEKKESVFGGFTALMKSTPELLEVINAKLVELDTLLAKSNPQEDQWSMTDIRLYPVLRSLSIAKGVIWPAGVDAWRKKMAKDCEVALEDNVAF